MYCYNVLREPLLGLLLERLKSCLELEGAWQALEACLHGFQAVAESVHVSESNHLPAFFALLQTVPFSKLNIQVAITTLDVVGKLSSQTFVFKNQIVFLLTVDSSRSTAGFKLKKGVSVWKMMGWGGGKVLGRWTHPAKQYQQYLQQGFYCGPVRPGFW